MSAIAERRPRLRLRWHSYRKLCKEVLARDGWRCQRCGSMKELQVHHLCRRSGLGDDSAENLITFCQQCHRRIHLHLHDS